MAQQLEAQKIEVITDFIKNAVGSITEVKENIETKRVSVSIDADYCNAIVDKLKTYPQLATIEKAVIKLALNPLFKKIIMGVIAKELNVVEL